MAWPKGKKRDPNQKHGGGWSARKKKVETETENQPIQEATVLEVEQPSVASPQTETHTNFVTNGISDDSDFIKQMGIPTEEADKYKHQEEYNTFQGNVKPRGEHANIKTDPSILEVPEYVPPTVQIPQEPTKPIIAPNPQINDLSAGDKEKAASALVDVILNIWGFIKMFAGSKVGIDIEKVKKLAAEAKLDINSQIPIGGGEYVSFMQMIESFNSQAPQAFLVSDEFKNKVREPMIREFVKRGIGLTDMQLIMVFWGIEIATTGWNFVDLKRQGNKIIEQQKEIFVQLQKNNTQKSTPPPVTNTTTPDPIIIDKKEPATTQPKENYKEPEENK